ncbi:hypothetical protein NL676_008939 [Syzygium grande]|nr:hypothetical protein NL676_008939 [Syzygium grande]
MSPWLRLMPATEEEQKTQRRGRHSWWKVVGVGDDGLLQGLEADVGIAKAGLLEGDGIRLHYRANLSIENGVGY